MAAISRTPSRPKWSRPSPAGGRGLELVGQERPLPRGGGEGAAAGLLGWRRRLERQAWDVRSRWLHSSEKEGAVLRQRLLPVTPQQRALSLDRPSEPRASPLPPAERGACAGREAHGVTLRGRPS